MDMQTNRLWISDMAGYKNLRNLRGVETRPSNPEKLGGTIVLAALNLLLSFRKFLIIFRSFWFPVLSKVGPRSFEFGASLESVR